MATLRSTVKIDNRFGKITREYDRATRRALAEAAAVGAQVSRAKASERHRTGAMEDIKVTRVRDGRKGPNVLLVSTPSYAAFQEFGTLGSRKKKLSKKTLARQSSGSGQARLAKVAGSEGIKPLRFMGKGRTAARKTLLPLIQAHMSRVR